ncbi:hypothetical protein GCM10025857_21400 [Alicyclobacillus contaminans]|nr:hypothetical protein GCM10025857_21400 [Alicyclobacillus contaminans]
MASQAGDSPTHSTAYLGYTISVSTFILAMLGPVLGTIADYEGFKKKFFTVFFTLGIACTALLAFLPSRSLLWLLAVTVQLTHHSSDGVFSLILLFLIGIAVLSRVPNPSIAPTSSEPTASLHP